MLIQSVVVSNYCSFGENDNCLNLNPGITTIVGMNESGKSNLMNALGKVDLLNGIASSGLASFRNRITNNPIMISVRLLRAEDEPEDIVGLGATEISMCEDGKFTFSGAAAERYKEKVCSYDLASMVRGAKFDDSNQRNRLLTEISKLTKYQEVPLAKTRESLRLIKTYLERDLKTDSEKGNALNYIEKLLDHVNSFINLLPCAFSHKAEKRLKNSYTSQELSGPEGNNGTSIDKQQDDLLLSLLKVAELDRNELLEAVKSGVAARRETYEKRANRAIEEKVMRGFRSYYKKETEQIEMTFRVESNRLNIHISSGDASTAFSERSNGLKWYLQMYIDLCAQVDQDRPVVYILDEPGIYLHINAQDELRNMFFEQAKDGTQIVYSTHSPYMIDPNFAAIRSIVKTEDEEFSCICNSLYNKSFHKGNYLDTLSPIAAAMGMDIKLNFGLSREKINIIVEGITDQIYLQTMAKKLQINTDGFCVIPSTGADNSQHLCSILLGWGFRFIALFDYDNKGRQCATALLKNLNLRIGESVFLLKEITQEAFLELGSISQADSVVIESLLSEADRASIGVTTQDTKEQKKIAALKFSNAVTAGVEVSEETCENFKMLFSRMI